MKKLAEIVFVAIFLLAILGLNRGCTAVQSDNCRNDGGQPMTRYFDLEYTGCLKE